MQNQLMKLLSFGLVFFCLTSLNAQDNETQLEQPKKRTEIGLRYDRTEGLSILFKQELKKNMYFRSALKIPASGGFTTRSRNSGTNSKYFTANLSAGLEFQVPLSKRWVFYHGPELDVSMSHYSYDGNYSNSYKVGVGYFTGMIFKVNDRVSLSAEVKHGWNYSWQESRNVLSENTSTLYRGLNFNSSLRIGATINLRSNKNKKEKFRF